MFTRILLSVALFVDFYLGWRLNSSYNPVKGVLPGSPLGPPRHARSHQPFSNTGCCHGEAPQPSRTGTLYPCHALTEDTRGVATGTTRRSSTATTACNASLHTLLREFGVSAEGFEGKCTLRVMYVYVGINSCVLIGRKRTYLVFQESCQAW